MQEAAIQLELGATDFVRPAVLADGRTWTEIAYDALRHDIISGHRAPAERLRLDRLRRLYGIGPTPLREALQRLAADGLVTAIGNRGFTVAPLDAGEFEDLNTARTALEVEAIRLSLAGSDAAWEARVAGAAYRLAKADAALAKGDAGPTDAWAEANALFHHAIVSACGSRWLLRLRDQLDAQCERYRRASVALKHAERDLGAEHRAIAAAALDRDAEATAALTAAHYRRTTDILVAELSG
jgi:DNA-binding GntR family transcriptional regulator